MEMSVPEPDEPHKPKFLEEVRRALRLRHYSIRTERTYLDWIRQFILFHGKRHPNDLGEAEVSAFLTHLAADRNVAASTQNQALSALLFLYQQFLQRRLGFLDDVERAKRPPKLPVVLTKTEAQAVIEHLPGSYRLMANLLYGSGLRLMECVRLLAHRPAAICPGRCRLGESKTSILPMARLRCAKARVERIG